MVHRSSQIWRILGELRSAGDRLFVIFPGDTRFPLHEAGLSIACAEGLWQP